LTSVQEVGWDAAVSRVEPGLQEYWFSKLRADFRAILPERRFGVALDLGCGAGAVTGALADSCGEIWGVDACLHSLRILRARAMHAGLSNLHVAHATATALPFADAQFDLIVMNGVLERVGYAGRYRLVQSSQAEALVEAYRCLRPGGYLYIGIENRFGANYLLGARDEHTGLRWVNVLPRTLANIYSQLARRKEFTAFTHSHLGLRGMLRQAGFQQSSFWSPLPSYREIRMLEPLMDEGVNLVEAIAKAVPHRVPGAIVHLSKFVPSFVWRHLSPHFAVVAKKVSTLS
jgi:ubiquinone/menaquinone biosynthesis C-methylase UbiE